MKVKNIVKSMTMTMINLNMIQSIKNHQTLRKINMIRSLSINMIEKVMKKKPRQISIKVNLIMIIMITNLKKFFPNIVIQKQKM